MDIQQLNRQDGEAVRIAFKNVAGGGSITTGFGIGLVTSAASFDGASVVTSTAATIKTINGNVA